MVFIPASVLLMPELIKLVFDQVLGILEERELKGAGCNARSELGRREIRLDLGLLSIRVAEDCSWPLLRCIK